MSGVPHHKTTYCYVLLAYKMPPNLPGPPVLHIQWKQQRYPSNNIGESIRGMRQDVFTSLCLACIKMCPGL